MTPWPKTTPLIPANTLHPQELQQRTHAPQPHPTRPQTELLPTAMATPPMVITPRPTTPKTPITPHNDEDEQPTKRTKTATDTTDPIDDTQEFSLWIPLERSVTDTVYQLIAQMFRKLSNDKTLQFIHSNKSTVPAPVCGIPDEEDMVGRHKKRILCNMAGLNSRISIEILTRQHGRNRRRTPTPPKAGNSKHKKGTEYTGDDGTDPTGTGQDHTGP